MDCPGSGVTDTVCDSEGQGDSVSRLLLRITRATTGLLLRNLN